MYLCRGKRLFTFLLFSIFLSTVSSELISVIGGGVAAIIAGFLAGSDIIRCKFHECCDDSWIATNFTALSLNLNQKLHGQHLVIDPVLKHLKGHARKNPSKALALSFHGWTGTGKNYVSKLVAEGMFQKGMKSKYVRLISATKEYPHEEMVHFYKDKLRHTIETAIKECPRSLFIFDEMDKMPAGVIDTIKPYLDYYENLGGVDYRRATFFFLSNTAGNDIAEKTISHWKSGNERKDLSLKDMETVIRVPAYNTERGFWHSELITKNLITAFIPFLPLERSHVKLCIRDGLVSKGYYKSDAEISDTKVQEIADELTYYPEDILIFSTTGCKRVHEKIDLILEEL